MLTMTSTSKEDAVVLGSSESHLDGCYKEDAKDNSLRSLPVNTNEGKNNEPDLESIEEELSISLSDDVNDGLRNEAEEEILDTVSVGSSSNKLNTTFDVHHSMPILEHCYDEDDPPNSNFRPRLSSTQDKKDDTESIIKQQQQELIVQAEQINSLIDQTRKHTERIEELEATIISANKTCSQLECMLKQELNKRSGVENDNLNLISEICKLRLKLNSSDQVKKRDDEKINLLNATLMERETEISILKLKLTRAQTNAPLSNNQLNQFQSTPINNPSSQSNVRLRPPSQNYSITRVQRPGDSSLYSTPSSQPVSNNQSSLSSNCNATPIYGNITSPYVASGLNQTISRDDRRYKTLPRNMPSSNSKYFNHNFYQQPKTLATDSIKAYEYQLKQQRSYSTVDSSINFYLKDCTITNLDDSNETRSTNTASSSGKGLSTANLRNINEARDNTYDQVPLSTSNINTNQSFGEESPYATIDKLGNTQSKSNSLMAKSRMDRTLQPSEGDITAPQHQLPMVPKQKSGFRRILNKFKRSGSGSTELKEVDDILMTINHNNSSSFRRGGNRSTTSGAFQATSGNQHLSMNMPLATKKATFETTKPFGEWDTNMIAQWLTTIGLSMYSNQCRRWAKNGSHIMNATASEVERGLCISNTLHRKKLRLAISELNGDCDKVTKTAANLDYLWVARWLDDIGLPQYKEQFINNRIDGRVLNYLTVEDLVSMNITSLLHHASIRCGIRVLRSINFDLQALKRRATSDEIDGMMQWSTNQQNRTPSRFNTFTRSSIPVQGNSFDSGVKSTSNTIENSHPLDETITDSTLDSDSMSRASPNITRSTEPPAALGVIGVASASGVPSDMPAQPDIALWTCHRVMEWLRLIDFSEFAPNLRGSGVHGGLIIYEDGFNADLMSTLLSIPEDKTLLRRHIYSLFKELIGKELFRQKRQYEAHPHYHPLTPSSELKCVKKSQFSLLRRSRSKVGQDTTVEEYLCPTYPIETRFKQHAAENAARDAVSGNQSHVIDRESSPTYVNSNQIVQAKQSDRIKEEPSDITIV